MTNERQSQTSSNQGKVAIVTGASRGIGAAIAKRLASDGFTVVVNYAGRSADAGAIVDEIKSMGRRRKLSRRTFRLRPRSPRSSIKPRRCSAAWTFW